jgi:hypothetical protein
MAWGRLISWQRGQRWEDRRVEVANSTIATTTTTHSTLPVQGNSKLTNSRRGTLEQALFLCSDLDPRRPSDGEKPAATNPPGHQSKRDNSPYHRALQSGRRRGCQEPTKVSAARPRKKPTERMISRRTELRSCCALRQRVQGFHRQKDEPVTGLGTRLMPPLVTRKKQRPPVAGVGKRVIQALLQYIPDRGVYKRPDETIRRVYKIRS